MSSTRRTFIKTSAVGAAGAAMTGPLTVSSVAAPKKVGAWVDKMQINPDISNMRVVCFQDEKMCPTTPVSMRDFETMNKTIDAVKVSENMDKMAMELAQKATPDDAWKTIFRTSKPWDETKIAIKINGVMNNLARVAVVKKIADVMIDLGAAPENIVVYDGHGNAAGSKKYTPYGDVNDITKTKIRGKISEKFKDMGGVEEVTVPGISQKGVGPKNLVSGITDILVNVAVNKGHLPQAGTTTLCLKAHFGTFINEEGGTAEFFHTKLTDAIININKLDAIIGGDPVRQQLCIIDSLWASQGGPSGSADTKLDRLIMGTFAGAVDYCCVKKVREEVENWKHEDGVVTKFLTEYGYNEDDPEWVAMDPTETISGKVNPIATSRSVTFTMKNPGNRKRTLTFSFPEIGTHPIQTRIFDLRGRLAAEISIPAGVSTVNWNGKTLSGAQVKMGTYVVEMSTGNFKATDRLTVVA